MALEASNFTRKSIANAEFGGTPHVEAGTYTLKLFSDTVDLDGVGTELSNTGYDSFDFTNNLTNFPTTTNGTKTNAVAFQMDTLTEDSDEIVSAGLFDENDELRYRKVYDTPFTIENGQFYILNVGDLTFTAV